MGRSKWNDLLCTGKPPTAHETDVCILTLFQESSSFDSPLQFAEEYLVALSSQLAQCAMCWEMRHLNSCILCKSGINILWIRLTLGNIFKYIFYFVEKDTEGLVNHQTIRELIT